ncbi:MAG TPA: hypothetical protein VH062_32195 [Polyangiaceae bacterium]|jgi:hypothetical protein|nr:hypothetical protein [Polyangiaceae bacterium]
MKAEKSETKPASTAAPKKPKKARAKTAKKAVIASVRNDALLGKRFTHRSRAEWGIGTVVDGAENLVVLAWSDGAERRTARTFMDQLVEVP